MIESDTLCVLKHKGRRLTAVYGLICEEHAADLRDLLADVLDLWNAHSSGDLINPEASEAKQTKKPHPSIELNLNKWLIDNPSKAPAVEWNWDRNGNPATGRMESNGPDSPAIFEILDEWCDYIAEDNSLPYVGDTALLPDLIGYLRSHLSVIAASDWIDDFMWELRNCRRALASAVGENPAPRPIASCPYCGGDLYSDRQHEQIRLRRDGKDPATAKQRADKVTCRPCRYSWSGVELLRLKLISEAS